MNYGVTQNEITIIFNVFGLHANLGLTWQLYPSTPTATTAAISTGEQQLECVDEICALQIGLNSSHIKYDSFVFYYTSPLLSSTGPLIIRKGWLIILSIDESLFLKPLKH